MAKSDRLLAVLWLLHVRRKLTARELAGALEVDVRTVYRDIQSLSMAGVPVIAEPGPGGGYRLADDFTAAPLYFAPDEARELFVAAHLARATRPDRAQALDSAVAKIRRTLSPEVLAELEGLASRTLVDFGRPVPGGATQDLRVAVERAVVSRRTVEMRYDKPGRRDPRPRRLDPYGILFQGSVWLVVGYCHRRREIRTFRLDRMSDLRVLDATFRVPESFRLEDHLPESWIRPRLREGATETVEIRGAPHAIQALAEHWYLRHCHPKVAAGGKSLTVSIDPIGRRHLLRTLLVNEEVELVRPSAMRHEMVAEAQRLADRYRSSSEAPGGNATAMCPRQRRKH